MTTRLGPRLALVGVITFAVATLALDARATYGARVTADEPQYLLTALSLAEDRDLDISDELTDERFRSFHEVSLDPQTIALNDNGQRLSPHDPLLPLILAPAMLVGGWVGAKLTLAVIAAATAMATLWLAVRRFEVSATGATLVVMAAFAAPPLTSYATQAYPEMPAALAVVAAIAAVTSRRPYRASADLLLVLAVVSLPWLSVKYVPLAAVLVVARVAAARDPGAGGRARLAGVLAVLGAAGIVYLVVHQRVYGGWTVYAAGDHFVGGEVDVIGQDPNYGGRSRRLVGLLVDRSFGLVPWTPAYLLAVPALVATIRRRSSHWPLMAATVAIGWAMATWVAFTMHGWWWPGRQIVVVLPLIVVAIASLVDHHRRRRVATVAGFAVGTVSWLWLAFEASTDRRTLVFDFSETASPLYRLLSPLFPNQLGYALTGRDLALTIVWTVLVIGSGVAAALATAPRAPR